MHWIALQWRPESAAPDVDATPTFEMPRDDAAFTREALGWWALQFTPHVVWLDEALLLEVSGSLRLWGGRRALMRRILESNPASLALHHAQAAVGLVALALLRQRVRGQVPPADLPAALPLDSLSAARPHLPLLARLGLRCWGEAHALPRGPMVRRFGVELRRALDIAWGLAPESYPWLTLPDRFDQSLELPAHVQDAPALLWSANRLLASLQLWLRARQRGVLAFELKWTLDLKRLHGRELPPVQALVIRTAEPAQAMEHLRRLLAERLAHTAMLAPANGLRLRSLDTAPWQATSRSFLPEEQRDGDPLHVFVERVGARLGPASVLRPVLRADHRPECMQRWQAADETLAQRSSAAPPMLGPSAPRVPGKPMPGGATPVPAQKARATVETHAKPSLGSLTSPLSDALTPTWLLREPEALVVRDGQPCHGGVVLRLLTPAQRIETGWWSGALPEGEQAGSSTAAARDYFIARGARAELLWVYRERRTAARAASGQAGDAAPRWFLQGRYA